MRECGARAVVPVREDTAATMTEQKKQQRADWEEEVRIGGSLANVPLENEVYTDGLPRLRLSFLHEDPTIFKRKLRCPVRSRFFVLLVSTGSARTAVSTTS